MQGRSPKRPPDVIRVTIEKHPYLLDMGRRYQPLMPGYAAWFVHVVQHVVNLQSIVHLENFQAWADPIGMLTLRVWVWVCGCQIHCHRFEADAQWMHPINNEDPRLISVYSRCLHEPKSLQRCLRI